MSESEPAERSRILFVDDEPRVVEGLRRMLHSYRKRWEMVFVTDPEEALRLAREKPFDVVISDMRMPGLNGAELLERIRELSAGTIRIILSGQSETSAIMKSVGPSHQFLTKPCNGADIERAVAKACRLRTRLRNPALLKIAGGIEKLPSLPSIYTQVVEAIRNEASLQEIGAIISRDIAMTAKLLQLVNSSYFGLAQQVNDPGRAAMYLGTETLQALVLGAGIFDKLNRSAAGVADVEALWKRSSRTAAYARIICMAEEVDEVTLSQAVTASLLHDIGILILATHVPDLLARARELEEAPGLSQLEAERAVLGVTHAEFGAYLAGVWSFPDDLVDAVAHHHSPEDASAAGFGPVTVVHVAQALAFASLEEKTPEGEEPPLEMLNRDYLEGLGLFPRLPVWIERCRQVTGDG